MKVVFINYPKCSTCKKAREWLIKNNIDFQDRNIKEDIPTKNELDFWVKENDISIDKFFNTSGILYRELNLSQEKNNMAYEEKLELLSSNGMLIKRPILVTKNKVYIGFKEAIWQEIIK